MPLLLLLLMLLLLLGTAAAPPPRLLPSCVATTGRALRLEAVVVLVALVPVVKGSPPASLTAGIAGVGLNVAWEAGNVDEAALLVLMAALLMLTTVLSL
jgi:hypothetical protein